MSYLQATACRRASANVHCCSCCACSCMRCSTRSHSATTSPRGCRAIALPFGRPIPIPTIQTRTFFPLEAINSSTFIVIRGIEPQPRHTRQSKQVRGQIARPGTLVKEARDLPAIPQRTARPCTISISHVVSRWAGTGQSMAHQNGRPSFLTTLSSDPLANGRQLGGQDPKRESSRVSARKATFIARHCRPLGAARSY